MELKFRLKGLDCAHCAAKLEEFIKEVDGVKEVSISFMTLVMMVTVDEIRKDEVVENIKKLIEEEEPDVVIEEA